MSPRLPEEDKMPPMFPGGGRTISSGKPVHNRILLSITAHEYRRIRSSLEFVELSIRDSLHEPHERIRFAYFLNSGLASIVVSMRGGRDVEAGVVGLEGMVGTPIAVGLEKSPLRVVMQIPGNGFKIHTRSLEAVLATTPDLRLKLTRYAVLQGMQVAQTAACNRLHDMEQRLSRWLLMAQDRVASGVLPITHDFLAIMLGTDRPGVTSAVGMLERKKTIRCRRGQVEILNRRKLEAQTCECYRVIHLLNRQLGLK
jgi:CRP-like cAMP-binding protein